MQNSWCPRDAYKTSQLYQLVGSVVFVSPEAVTGLGMDLCTWSQVTNELPKCSVAFPAKPKAKIPHPKNYFSKAGERISPATKYYRINKSQYYDEVLVL